MKGVRWQESLAPVEVPKAAQPLRWHKTPNPGQYTARSDSGYYVITLCMSEGPRGGRVYEYEVEATRNGKTRVEYGIYRLDSAKDMAQRIEDAHLTGEDR